MALLRKQAVWYRLGLIDSKLLASWLPPLRYKNTSPESHLDDENQPLKYTSSKASSWKARYTRRGEDDDKPWYQGLVVSLSMGTFLLYFCVFREENNIDEELGRSLYSRIEGLEESQLRISLKYNQEHGLDTRAIEQRLKELEEERM